MRPPFSVILLTTLIGAGQGLYLALYIGEFYGVARNSNSVLMILVGALLVVVLMVLGASASLFHLGRPERSWRAIAQWRTSWLSREAIVLPTFTGVVMLWGLIHMLGANPLLIVIGVTEIHLSLIVGFVGALLALLLYLCTSMIYVAVKCIQEWASPLTVLNYLLLGLASGFTIATALASLFQRPITAVYVSLTILMILASAGSRILSLFRNAQINRKSSIETALGIPCENIRQPLQGAKRESHSHEFLNHTNQSTIFFIMILFPITVFVIPLILVIYGWAGNNASMLVAAVLIQLLGLLAERWLFFAQATQTKNIYFQG